MSAPSRFAPGGIRYCYDPASNTEPMANRSAGMPACYA